MDALGEIITKVLTETLLKWDSVTQERAEFWISLDGLTNKKRTGEAVVLTTFVGGERVDFLIGLKETKKGASAGQVIRLLENAMASVGM